MKSFIPSKPFKAFLRTEVERIKGVLLIPDYTIAFKFVDRVAPYKHIPDKDGYTFEIEVNLIYLDACISVSKKAQKRFDDGELKKITEDLYHELSHIITSPLQDISSDKRKVVDGFENLTERIARIAINSNE